MSKILAFPSIEFLCTKAHVRVKNRGHMHRGLPLSKPALGGGLGGRQGEQHPPPNFPTFPPKTGSLSTLFLHNLP